MVLCYDALRSLFCWLLLRGAARMSAQVSDFLAGSLGTGGTGSWLDAALDAPLAGAHAARPNFLAFHVAHVRGSKDNAAINSLCLPVFANAAHLSAVADQERSVVAGRGGARGGAGRAAVRGAAGRGGATRGGATRGGAARGGAARGGAARGAARGGSGRGRGSGRRGSADGDDDADGAVSDPADSGGSDRDAELFVTRSGRATKRKTAPPGAALGGPVRRTLSEDVAEVGELDISVRGVVESRPVPNAPPADLPRVRKTPLHLPDHTQQYQLHAGPINVTERMEIQYDGEPLPLEGLVVVDSDGRVTSVPGLRNPWLPFMLRSQLERLRIGGFRLTGIAPEALPSAHTAVFERSVSRTIHRVRGIKGVPIVPSALWDAVESRGGFNKVRHLRLWLDVKNELQLPESTSSSFTIKEAFTEYFDVSPGWAGEAGRAARGCAIEAGGDVETQPFGYVVGRLREEKTQHASPSEPLGLVWGLI